MATYWSLGRTNYFSVNDADAFRKEVDFLIGSTTDISEQTDNDKVQFCLCFPDGIPNCYIPEDSYDDIEIDMVELIGKHLADGEVCILQEVGAESLRYLSGSAIAFNNKGEVRSIDLYTIHDMAKELGEFVTEVLY